MPPGTPSGALFRGEIGDETGERGSTYLGMTTVKKHHAHRSKLLLVRVRVSRDGRDEVMKW